MSVATVFFIVFAVAWLAVVGATVAHFMRPRQMRREISLLARAGLLIWFTGVLVATFANTRHWPANQVGPLNDLRVTCKLVGFAALLVAGLVRLGRRRRAARTGSGTWAAKLPAGPP
jgi:surface polysaccharide O-acyltransferase-like enzyme